MAKSSKPTPARASPPDASDPRPPTSGAGRALSEEERIRSDIVQFHANVKEVPRTPQNAYILDLASQYCEDTAYFLDKKDYVTAFGAINYAHGLIDAFRKAKG